MPSSNGGGVGEQMAGGGGLQAQTERPEHYKYLKEFRVEQCPLFPQHKCALHRPFSCFYWHFPNQRRRRPVRRRDGTFNYSSDLYCAKYDEGSGVCPEGDECPLLHRTAGDTERRYHLRYYKTCMCVYETDSKGACLKNGAHCAFAHGEGDRRPPVFDAREQQQPDPDPLVELTQLTLQPPQQPPSNPHPTLQLDDPRWQSAPYVLLFYKTEPCRRPPRLCRQGYACPHYHNQRDRRRSPQLFKYRSTPCPSVKRGDEWGEPGGCEEGDECSYCHTRTEQQFHPEIYKSSKCHDVFTLNYCPRGPFCAFAHLESEMGLNRVFPMEKALLAELVRGPAASEPIDIFKPAERAAGGHHSYPGNNSQPPAPLQGTPTTTSGLSYSSAVGGRGFMNGILQQWEDDSRRRRRESEGGEADQYWLFPSTQHGTPTQTQVEDRGLLLEDDEDYLCGGAMATADPIKSVFTGDQQLRADVLYLPLPLLNGALVRLREHLELVEGAVELHGNVENCACLVCRERYRSHLLLPCQHQVVCASCLPPSCPVCGGPVGGRRHHSAAGNNGVGPVGGPDGGRCLSRQMK